MICAIKCLEFRLQAEFKLDKFKSIRYSGQLFGEGSADGLARNVDDFWNNFSG
jgi:hypothetical protein